MIRPRREGDMMASLLLLERVYAVDQYPAHWPNDPSKWLAHRREICAWVALRDDVVVGHVAIHDAHEDQALSIWQSFTNRTVDQLEVVARLLVDPDARRNGLGSALLDTAVQDIHLRGRLPVLDVAEKNLEAINLYDKCDWRRIAQFDVDAHTDSPLPVIVYVGPDPPGK